MSESTIPDYKNTIRLPQTEFPMKGNLPTKEPELISFWEQNQIYQKMIQKNKGKKSFVLPDGPPYANGSIHIGHALNKTLKDIVIKYKNMTGHHAPFIPGWDCHGLPIEHKVMKDLGDKAKTKTNSDIRSLCREEAQKWVTHQQSQFVRLGILADWKNRYLTMDKVYEAEEVREFARAFKAEVLYRGEKPVYWNWALQTALADAEVEYHNHKSPAIYVKFEIKDQKTLIALGGKNDKKTFVAIWTTTPWTLPANVGICFHPEFNYSLYECENEEWLIADGLKESFEKDTSKVLTKSGASIKGKDLLHLKARHPFIDRDSIFVLGDYVSLDAGTGCVHTAPGHGMDDYKTGLTYGLPVLSPVDDKGCYTADFKEMEGINIFKANPMIVEKLKASNHLIHFKEIEHSYPHCWRSKVPLIFRATPQWFIGLDIEKNNIRKLALNSIRQIQFFPQWGEARLKAMLENRPDWCLSRQRTWGVPIPVFYCKATGEPLLDYDVMMNIADVMEKENGIESFHNHPPEFFINDKKMATIVKGKFGSEGFKHGKDILDVWFDSGVCHAAVQKRREGMRVPADIYLEGSDQHRGWFNTSLLSSLVTNGIPPFKSLITHGFVTDAEGKKMSKSKGNTVDPNETAAKSGAEIIRLWTVYEDYGQDLTCGQELLTRVSETYRRIRNTMRFLLGALNDFDSTTEMVKYEDLMALDKWALHETNQLIINITKAFDNYEFYKVYHLLNTFYTTTLSATYLDILKDRLYTWKHNGIARKSAQTTLFIITDTLIRTMTPVLSFLAEETYSYIKNKKQESVFLLNFPTENSQWNQPDLADEYEVLLKLREIASKELENIRTQKIIGSSLEAQLIISAEGNTYSILNKYIDTLKEFFIVSNVTLKSGPQKIEAIKAEGIKCVRCWNYDTATNANTKYPMLCPKCVDAVSALA